MAVQNFGVGGGYQLSPGINVSEIDLTTVVPPVATTVGAIAGVFAWGPVGERILVSSENDLVKKFGKPSSINPETFFTAASFLSYSNALYVSRAANVSSTFSAIANTDVFSANAAHSVKNYDDYEAKESSFDPDVQYIARWPGALGNSLKVSVCDSANAFSEEFNLPGNSSVGVGGDANVSFENANTKLTISVGSNTATITLANNEALAGDSPEAFANTVSNLFLLGDYIEVGNNSIGKQKMKITGKSVEITNTAGTNTGYADITLSLDQPLKLSTAIDTSTVTRYWEYHNQVDKAPGQSNYVLANGNTAANDEVHVVIVDEDGKFTGAPGQVLEVFEGLSRATDAKLEDNATNYYKTSINKRSAYAWFASDRAGAVSNTATNVESSGNRLPLTISFQGGVDNYEGNVAFAELANAYDLYADPADVDVSLVVSGKARGGTNGEQLLNYLIDNIAEVRKDCMVFGSPEYDDVVNAPYQAADNIVEFRNSARSSSYAVLDSGYKQTYDKYNDIMRYIPLNGDIAGICAATDRARDPWYSPGGITRGRIRNAIKLAYVPSKADRDVLYKNGINPVIKGDGGEGIYMNGDKTLLAKPSAFDRINVRRLFIVIEKAIAAAVKPILFEFNDEFTRTQFRNTVEPYLRDIQGRRGIFDFRVVCDETNNTAEVVDSNRFVGDIYVKPARSINYIQLNFVAVRTGIEFTEIVG